MKLAIKKKKKKSYYRKIFNDYKKYHFITGKIFHFITCLLTPLIDY